MEQENEGIAYLTALKQSIAAEAATAAAPAHEASAGTAAPAANGNVQEHFQGAEKRRSPRYKCEGSARICEEGCEVPTWVTFTDISLHGCYVEAQATYPVGTALQLRLEAKDIKVETQGKVRVNYPYLGMGIAFIDMSEENKTRLKEMLGSISRHSIIMGPGIASALPAREIMAEAPLVSDPIAAIKALMAFFEDRQMLMREDFLRIVKQSQAAPEKK